MHRFEHRSCATVGIDRPVHPGIAVVARNDPLVGHLAALNLPDHIPDGSKLIILLEMHFDLHRSRADVVRERQRTLPLARSIRTTEALKNWPCISVRQWS